MKRLIVRAASPNTYGWMAAMTGWGISQHYRAIEAVNSRGEILGQVGFDNWTPRSVQMHVAITTPIAARALIRAAFEFVFENAGKEVAIGIIPSHNWRSLKLAKHLGFTEFHRMVDGWNTNSDLIFMWMHKNECRWLKPEEQREAA